MNETSLMRRPASPARQEIVVPLTFKTATRRPVRIELLESRRLLSTAVTSATLDASGATAITIAEFQQSLFTVPANGSTFTFASGADGTITVTGTDGSTFRWNGNTLITPLAPAPAPVPDAAPTPASRATTDIAFTLGTVVQADGKVVVASLLADKLTADQPYQYGESHREPGFNRISLTRYNADGSIDASFATAGSAAYTLGKIANSGYGNATGAVADAQGRILVVYSDGIVRFNADGSLDATFGNGGVVTHDYPWALKLQNDGKILVVTHNAVERLNTDGSADTMFTKYSLKVEGSRWPFADLKDAAVAPDGSIYVVGEIRTANEGQDVALTSAFISKLHADGTADTTFATGGRYELGHANRKWESFNGVAVLADGKIQVLGKYSFLQLFETPPSPDDFYRDAGATVLARFNPDGSLDASYGTGGIITDETLSMDDIFGMIVLPDGRIVASTYGVEGSQLFVANADGSGRRFVERRIKIDFNNKNPADYNGYLSTYTQAPSLAPDGSIVTGVGINDLYNAANRNAADTYWTRINLDGPDGVVAEPVEGDPVVVGFDAPVVDQPVMFEPEIAQSATPVAAIPAIATPNPIDAASAAIQSTPFSSGVARVSADLLGLRSKDELFDATPGVLV